MKIPQCRKKPPATRHITSIMGLGLLGACLAITATCARAFSLLGPYTSWMDEAKSFRRPGQDIGGPMNIGEGYRWNVPVVTYGFDASFLQYFGSNGVAAVEGAIAIFNNLPLASQLDPASYPTRVIRVNSQAASQGLIDLNLHFSPYLLPSAEFEDFFGVSDRLGLSASAPMSPSRWKG